MTESCPEHRPARSPVIVSAGSEDDLPAVDTVRAGMGWRPLLYLAGHENLLLGRRDGGLAGAMIYWIEEPDIYLDPDRPAPYSHEPRLKIVDLFVVAAARRSGVGRALVRESARIASDVGLPWMWSWPSPNDTAMQVGGRVAFFAACGMREHRPDDEHLEMIGRPAEVLAATSL